MKIKKINEEYIEFDNGYKLEYYHDQDCCECVYADFEAIKNYNVSTITGKKTNIKDIDFCEDLKTLIIGVKEMGFNMVSKIGEKFFIPCYNQQNGFYGSDLKLILTKKEYLDISEYVKDEID